MPGVDRARLVAVVTVVGSSLFMLGLPRLPQHPQRNTDDDDSRDNLKVRLGRCCIKLRAEVEPGQRDSPHDRRV